MESELNKISFETFVVSCEFELIYFRRNKLLRQKLAVVSLLCGVCEAEKFSLFLLSSFAVTGAFHDV